MPAVAAVAIAAGSVAAAGGVAAVGAGIMAGSLTALAVGATVVGAALTVAGQVTGSKTLGKIGMGFTIAGGIGGLAAGARGATATAANAEGAVAARAADLSTTEGLLASKTPGVKDVIADNAFKTFNATGTGGVNSVSGAIESGSNIGNLATEPSVFERFNASLNKYNGAMNVVGGIGDAVMENQRTSAFVNQSNKDRDFQREVSNRDYTGTAGTMPGRNVSFNPTSQGLLRGGTTIPNVVPAR